MSDTTTTAQREATAMQAVADALESLPQASARRVIAWVSGVYAQPQPATRRPRGPGESVASQVREYVRGKAGETYTIREVSAATGCLPGPVRTSLSRLVDTDVIERLEKGLYSTPGDGETT